MRLFVSIDFPHEVITYISLLQKKLFSKEFFEGKLINPAQLHLTVQFIGDVAPENILLLQEALSTITMPAFKVCLGSIGVFPAQDYVRIIYLELKGKKIYELAKKVRQVLEPLCRLEDRPFLSHITIARVKTVKNREKLLSYLTNFQIEPICFSVSEFLLNQSVLSARGPEYTTIERYQLQ